MCGRCRCECDDDDDGGGWMKEGAVEGGLARAREPPQGRQGGDADGNDAVAVCVCMCMFMCG